MLQRIALDVERVCDRMKLDRQRARELADVAISALGSNLFENPKYTKDPVTLEHTPAHPLLRNIIGVPATPEVGTGELIELGQYLKTLYADPAILDLLASLRNEREYNSTLFHLAIAYRLQRIGGNPRLEPKTDRGKSDILFTFEDCVYVAECYRVHTNFFEHVGTFESLLARRMIHAAPRDKKYRFRIHINSPLSNDGMRRMLRKADELLSLIQIRDDVEILQLRQGPHVLSGEDITSVTPDPDYDYPGLPARPLRNDEADLIVGGMLVEAENVFELPPYSLTGEEHNSRALVRRGYERALPKNPYEVLSGKIGHKLKQTKVSGSDYRRLLFVEFPWGLEPNARETLTAQGKLRENFIRNFPAVGGVILLERRPLRTYFGYRGTFLPGADSVAAPKSLFDQLSKVEEQGLLY